MARPPRTKAGWGGRVFGGIFQGQVNSSVIISFGIRVFEGILELWDNAVKLANAPCSFYFSTI
jgi:hypothetical protein